MIQLFAAAKCPKIDILLQQIAESLSKWIRPSCSHFRWQLKTLVFKRVVTA